ncbi:MFS transporter [Mangrovihabitans endophyticus]|uniref:MFS transporter n=1 Tax=Mangrovihabitans endophyticus TaxID=1751298 RepID=A0A8J3C326_9ACTN|nr:MFS transporter [Mangrovihabitans endophyticus]GGL08048.1 MFS transporter [Mangrovihabitans endophyticus]
MATVDVEPGSSGQALVARLDRLPRHAVAYAASGIVGLAMFVAFYCNFNINVSFIQTCSQIKAGCTAENANEFLSLPVVLFLVGYMVGCLLLAPLSDRLGRRPLLAVVLGFAAVGSLVTVVATAYPVFVLGRALTGVVLGGVLAVGNTYIGEIAPSSARARYTAITFVMCTVGAMVGIGLGLVFTTASASFPDGLPIALAGPDFTTGWRWIYGIAVLTATLAALAVLRLPESPRWLIEHGRLAAAERVVRSLEERALRRGPLREPDMHVDLPEHEKPTAAAYRELFADPCYRNRALLLVSMWITGYATVFAYSTGSTSVLTGLDFTPPVAGMISAVGGIGFFAQGLFSAKFSESVERRYWLPIGAALTIAGAVLIATLGDSIGWAFIGSFIVFFGFNVWVPPTFALSAESFPTRIRSAGFGLVDGFGVTGGMIGVLVIAPLVGHLSALQALLLISSFQVVAAVLAQFTPRTRNRALEDVSP